MEAIEPSRNSSMSNASHWRQDVHCRIFSGWRRQRRNATPAGSVGIRGPDPGPRRLNTQERTMPVMGRKLVPALLIAGISATAGAQQKACEIDESTPAQ